MGYSTQFKGKLRFDNPITVPEMVKLDSILGEDVRDHPEWNIPEDLYFTYVDLEITNGVTGLQWDGSEKTYEMPELIKLVIRLMQEEFPDFSLSGSLFAQGEDVGDVYTISVDKNKVEMIPFGDE